jgi:hypothetical protein
MKVSTSAHFIFMNNFPRHDKADPKCLDCHGYGYIHIDDERVEIQRVGHYIEYAWQPIFSECHCTETITETTLHEATNRTPPDYF